MKSKLIVIYSLALTGLVCYLHAIFYSLGIVHTKVVSPFFDSRDLFADYIKHVGSFGSLSTFRIEGWLPSIWQDIFNSYLSSNPYASDPRLASSTLTHFHAPPLVVVLAKGIMVPLFADLGVITSYLLLVSIFLLAMLFLVNLCFDRLSEKFIMGPAVLLLYPCVFAFTRGNLYAIISSFFIISSFLLISRSAKYWLIAIILICISIGLRPNNIVLLPFLCILCKKLYGSAVPPIPRLFASSIACLASTGIASLMLANRVYPDYTISLFMKAYSFYSHTYEYGGAGADYSSSMLQPMRILVLGLEKVFPYFALDSLFSTVRILCLILGLSVCVYSCMGLMRRRVNIARSLFVCIIGMIIATPVFADYHLTILIAPILLAAYFEKTDSTQASQQIAGMTQSLPIIDSMALILLLVPKSFPLLPLHTTAQTFINPLIMVAYLAAILSNSRLSKVYYPAGVS